MTISYEVDLKEVLAQINQRLERIEQKSDALKEDINELRVKDINDLKVGQARLEERVNSLENKLDEKIARLEEKLDQKAANLGDKIEGLTKRIDSQEFVSRGVLIGLILALLGGLAKLFGIPGGS
ncbi:DUF1640 domain-containing protein [bacterium]|nr:DUF1640 domain-containing protein [bacterium]